MPDVKAFFAAFIILALPWTAWAKDYRFTHIEAENGLSNNRINSIFKDRDGFLWIGTAAGLNRYDGHHIKTYRQIPGDSTSLAHNYVYDIHQDPRGYIWIQAGDSYSKYDPLTDTFDNNPVATFREMGVSGIPSSLYLADGCLWMDMPDDEGLFFFSTGRAKRVPGVSENGTIVEDIVELPRQGGVAIVDNYGKLFLVNQNGEVVHTDESVKNAINENTELKLTADSDGRLWVYGDKGLWAYNTLTRQWLDLPFGAGKRNPIRAVAQDSDGNLWFGLDNDGLTLIDRAGVQHRIVKNAADPDGLGNNSITVITTDNDGNVWVGTQKKGISAYNSSEFKFGLVSLEDVNCAAPGPGNTCWIGTDSDGLKLLDLKTGKVTSYPDAGDGTRHAPITSLTPSSDGGVWISTYSGGLKKFKNGVFTRYGASRGVDTQNVWGTIENPDGTLWVATLGKGLMLINQAGGLIKSYSLSNSGLDNDYLSSICRGDNGKIYIGTTIGLYVYDPADGQITKFTGNNRDGSYYVSQVFYDSRGLLWIATDNGIDVFDTSRGVICELPAGLGNVANYVLGVIEANAGDMWVAIDGGLLCIKVQKDAGEGYLFKSHAYGSRDGLQNAVYNQRSLAKMSNGDIVAGGPYGLSRISPQNIRYNKVAPKILFSNLYLGNVEVKPGQEYDGHVILDKSLNHTEKVVLDHKQNNFTIEFAANNYVQTNYTSYFYKLSGVDKDWNECLPGVHHVTFTNLPSGNYTLFVKAINNDGVESATRKLLIYVKPPFWASPWATLIYLILVAGGVVLLFKLVKRGENRRIAEIQQAEYANKQEEIARMKDKFFTNVSHELRTPLTLIISPIESLLRETTDQQIKSRLQLVHGNAKRLLSLVNQLLDFKKNEDSSLKFNATNGDIVAFVRSVLDTFVIQAERKEIVLGFNSTVEKFDMQFDEDKMGKTIGNLLSNAIKFTPRGGSVTVNIRIDGGDFILSVVDSGCGIADDEKDLIFQRYYQSRNPKGTDGETGTGIGLSLVSEYVTLHDGAVKVTDTEGGGSTFTITIPIKRAPGAATRFASPFPQGFPAVGNASPSSSTATPATKPVIMVVDDNYDMVNFLKTELDKDYNVLCAYDGLEAIDMLKENHVDLILSDLMMPRMDGIELCRRVKSTRATRNIPVIILTARHDAGSEIEGLTLGADDYMTKPFNNDILKVKISKLIDRGDIRPLRRSPINPEPEPVEITPLDEQFINKAKKYVEDNVSRSDLSVEELSRELGMSRVHLYKKILKLTGKTPTEFIRILRLKLAAQYLRESQLNISEIAYKLGFNNPKYFSRYFQEEYGMTPSEYQKKEGK